MILSKKIKSLFVKSIFLLFLVLFVNNIFAQDSLLLTNQFKKPDYKNEFRTSYIGLFNNIIFIGYERFFKNKTSLVLNAEAKYSKNYYGYFKGYQGELQYRFYYFTKYKKDYAIKLDGLYAAAYGIYGYQEYTSCSGWYVYPCDQVKENKPIAGGGILTGLKFTILNKISLDFNLGGGVRYNLLNNRDYFSYYDNNNDNGIRVKSNITIGFKF